MIQKKIRLGDLEFDCRLAGDETNPAIVFLHGFPEASIMWTELMEKLSQQGYFCIAPDLRGYSKGACPGGVKEYTIDHLSDDVLGIAEALGKKKFHLVGHDWGAGIGWYTVYNHPDKILSWTALSVPHNSAFGKAYRLNEEQRRKSRYIRWFLLPWIPEMMIRRKDFLAFRKLWKNSPPEEVEEYLSIFRNKPSLKGAINYYRANIKRRNSDKIGEIHTPTLFIWGNTDLAISRFAADCNHSYMKGEYTFKEVDGGHWLVQTNYPEVEEALIAHLANH